MPVDDMPTESPGSPGRAMGPPMALTTLGAVGRTPPSLGQPRLLSRPALPPGQGPPQSLPISPASLRMAQAMVQQQSVLQMPPVRTKPKKVLKLTDDEIYGLYCSGVREACKEADWRGITGPKSDFGPGGSGLHAAPGPPVETLAVADGKEGKQECLQMLSRALQQSGRSPRSMAAEILEPAHDSVCCTKPLLQEAEMLTDSCKHAL